MWTLGLEGLKERQKVLDLYTCMLCRKPIFKSLSYIKERLR